MSKITPGPWTVNPRTYDARFEITVPYYDYWIALVGADNPDDKPYEKEISANARAIAKVPEMVELLKTIAEWHEDWDVVKQAQVLLKEIEG